jgi:DNA-binding MarR family transcriptional regulator
MRVCPDKGKTMSQSRLCIVPSEAVSDTRLTHVQLRVLLAIGSFTGKDKAAFPKQKTIADMLGLARETVNRAISALKRFGYIHVEHQHRDDGGQRESLYWVKLDPDGQSPGDSVITPPVTLTDHTPGDAQDHTARDAQRSHLRTFHKNDTKEADASLGSASTHPTPDPIPIEPKKSKGRVRGAARKTQLPDNWTPNIANLAYASKNGLTREEINHEADQFRNDACAKGKLFIDWNAAFRTWLGNAVKWRAERAAKSSARTVSGGQSRGGGIFAAGVRAVSEARAHSEPVRDDRQRRFGDDDLAPGYDIDGDPLRITGT